MPARNPLRLFRRASVEEEVDSELAFHIEMSTRELMELGMTHQQARAEAERRFGDANVVNAECRRYGAERDRKIKHRRRHQLHRFHAGQSCAGSLSVPIESEPGRYPLF